MNIEPTDEFKKENKLPEPREFEKPIIDFSNLEPTERVKVMTELPNVEGVENFVTLIEAVGKLFDGIYEAKQDDGKVSMTEAIGIGTSLVPNVLSLISGIANIPREVIYDRVSDADLQRISQAFDSIEHLKGDSRDAARDFLKDILSLKDHYFKYFVNPPVE